MLRHCFFFVSSWKLSFDFNSSSSNNNRTILLDLTKIINSIALTFLIVRSNFCLLQSISIDEFASLYDSNESFQLASILQSTIVAIEPFVSFRLTFRSATNVFVAESENLRGRETLFQATSYITHGLSIEILNSVVPLVHLVLIRLTVVSYQR